MSPLRAAPFPSTGISYQEDFPYPDGNLNGQGPWGVDFIGSPSLVVVSNTIHTDATGNGQSMATGVITAANMALPWSFALDFDYIYSPGNQQAFDLFIGDQGAIWFGIQVVDLNGDGAAASQQIFAIATNAAGTQIFSPIVSLSNSFRITLIFDGTSVLIDIDGIPWGSFWPGDMTLVATPNITYGSITSDPAAGFVLRQIAFAGFI